MKDKETLKECIDEMKELLGYRELKQPNDGIVIRSMEEEEAEWERCYRAVYGDDVIVMVG